MHYLSPYFLYCFRFFRPSYADIGAVLWKTMIRRKIVPAAVRQDAVRVATVCCCKSIALTPWGFGVDRARISFAVTHSVRSLHHHMDAPLLEEDVHWSIRAVLEAAGGHRPLPLPFLAQQLPDDVCESLCDGLRAFLSQHPRRYTLHLPPPGGGVPTVALAAAERTHTRLRSPCALPSAVLPLPAAAPSPAAGGLSQWWVSRRAMVSGELLTSSQLSVDDCRAVRRIARLNGLTGVFAPVVCTPPSAGGPWCVDSGRNTGVNATPHADAPTPSCTGMHAAHPPCKQSAVCLSEVALLPFCSPQLFEAFSFPRDWLQRIRAGAAVAISRELSPNAGGKETHSFARISGYNLWSSDHRAAQEESRSSDLERCDRETKSEHSSSSTPANADDERMQPAGIGPHDVYRVARFVTVDNFLPLSELAILAADVTHWDVLAVILAGGDLFEFDNPQDPKSVRYRLHPAHSLHELIALSEKELDEKHELSQAMRKSPRNHIKVRGKRLQEAVAVVRQRRALGYALSSFDPDVLAYNMFDRLPDHMIPTRDIVKCLPPDVASTTAPYYVPFLRQYPDLIRIYESDASFYALRADVRGPELPEEKLDTKGLILLLQSKIAAKSPNGAAVHLSKIHISLPNFVLQKIKNIGCKDLADFLARHPEAFTLTTNTVNERLVRIPDEYSSTDCW